VARAIGYFLRQDWPRRELVIIDDGTDPVEDLAAGDRRVRYRHIGPRRSIGHKRNVACELAHGELIAHWDDDDWYPASRIRRQVDELERSQADVCGSSELYFWEPVTGRSWHYRHQGPDLLLVGTTLLYRRSAWAKVPFADIQIGEDKRFVQAAGNRHDLADPSIAVGCVHAGNTSPKRTAGRSWSPVTGGEVQELLGDDAAAWPSRASAAGIVRGPPHSEPTEPRVDRRVSPAPLPLPSSGDHTG